MLNLTGFCINLKLIHFFLKLQEDTKFEDFTQELKEWRLYLLSDRLAEASSSQFSVKKQASSAIKYSDRLVIPCEWDDL